MLQDLFYFIDTNILSHLDKFAVSISLLTVLTKTSLSDKQFFSFLFNRKLLIETNANTSFV